MIDLSPLCRPPFPIEPTPEAVEDAKQFVFAKWLERHDERAAEWEQAFGRPASAPAPVDLSYSCKFTSVFSAVVFGGQIAGNHDHQFAVVAGEIVDLNEGAADIAGIEDIHEHDPEFFGNPDHLESVRSCLPRVDAWLSEYAQRLEAKSIIGVTSAR